MSNGWWVFLLIVAFLFIAAGCSSRPVIQTQIVEKPIAVPCQVQMPGECKTAYAVDRISPRDDALTINRALRTEIEERWACEVKLLAAVRGCNQVKVRP